MADVTALRQAIMGSLPVETSYFGATPDLTRLYLPPAHVKALRLTGGWPVSLPCPSLLATRSRQGPAPGLPLGDRDARRR